MQHYKSFLPPVKQLPPNMVKHWPYIIFVNLLDPLSGVGKCPEHHPIVVDIISNRYLKVILKIPKIGHLPNPGCWRVVFGAPKDQIFPPNHDPFHQVTMKSARAWHGPWRPRFFGGRSVQVFELPEKKKTITLMSCIE